MSKTYYECHVTLLAGSSAGRNRLEEITKKEGWKFSAIDGDINLGPGTKFYATRQFNARLEEGEVIGYLNNMADVLEKWGAEILRRKVERVIYDDRSSLVKPCTGGCVECHLDDISPQEQAQYEEEQDLIAEAKALRERREAGEAEAIVIQPITGRVHYQGHHYVIIESSNWKSEVALYCDDQFVKTFHQTTDPAEHIRAHAATLK